MKKVLIISYYFPPAGGSAVQRVLKFVKYLHFHGWHPVVLTAREKDYVLRDDSLLEEIPEGVKVFRTFAPDFYRWYGKSGKDKVLADLSAIAVGEGKKSGFAERIALFFRSLFFIPDARIGWLWFAFWRGRSILRKEKIQVIVTSSPPFTTALIGGLLSAHVNLPWISDYRDPWTQAYFHFPRPKLSRGIEEFMERRLLEHSYRITSINERILQGLQDKYGLWLKGKQVVIPNGYDSDDFRGIKPIKEDAFTITYTGTQNTKMNSASFLKAVKELSLEQLRFEKKLRIRFVGRVGNDVASLFDDALLKGKIHVLPHLSHRECLRYTIGADLLLLLIPEYPGNELIMTGKLFEYLRSGNPILCLSEKGDAADIVRETGSGFTVSPQNIKKIKSILCACFQRWERGEKLLDTPVRWDKVEKYDRKKTVQKWVHVLDESIKAHN